MNNLLNELDKINIFNDAYADDLCIIIEGVSKTNLKIRLQRALRKIDEWCKSSLLSISSNKSQLINIGRMKYKEEVIINKEPVEETESMKYLGVEVSKDLRFKKHLILID